MLGCPSEDLRRQAWTGKDRAVLGQSSLLLHSTRSAFYYVRVAVLGTLEHCAAFVGSGKLPSAYTAVGLRSLARGSYSRLADWWYISRCAREFGPVKIRHNRHIKRYIVGLMYTYIST